MKKLIIFSVTMCLATTASYAAPKKKAPVLTPDQQLQKYVSASYKVRPVCQKFQAQSQSLVKKEELKKPLAWGSQAQTLVRLLSTYPGNAPAYGDALKLVHQTPEPEKQFKIQHLTGFYTCPVMDYYAVARKLISSLPGFPKDQQKLVISEISKIATRELSAPSSLTEVFLQANLIKNLATTGLVPALAAQKPAIEHLMKNTRALNHDMMVSHTKTKPTVGSWLRENAYATQTASSWLDVLKKARL